MSIHPYQTFIIRKGTLSQASSLACLPLCINMFFFKTILWPMAMFLTSEASFRFLLEQIVTFAKAMKLNPHWAKSKTFLWCKGPCHLASFQAKVPFWFSSMEVMMLTFQMMVVVFVQKKNEQSFQSFQLSCSRWVQ